MERILLICGCGIFLVLGSVHIWLTFRSDKFDSRDQELNDRMRTINLVLTRQTTMWKAWVGFNASHSLGAMLYGTIYIVLALENYAYLRSSLALNALLVAVPIAYLALAIRYWFRTPRNGIALALALILASLALRLTG